MFWQVLLAGSVAVFLYLYPGFNEMLYFPFFKNFHPDLGILFIPFAAVVIVGDKKSANTKRLAAIAAEINPKSFMVESADQIDETRFKGLNTVGLTAGASTPDWIIADVEARLSKL